jgi:hypothetical protein
VKKNRKAAVSSARKRPGIPGEWVGGRASLPMYVGGDEPRRPDMVLWVAGQTPISVTTTEPGASEEELCDTLLDLLEQPSVPGARPSRLRVGSATLAALLREALGEEVPVTSGPTPEIDAAVQAFVAALPDLATLAPEAEIQGPSYFGHGGVPLADVAGFFEAAGRLFRAAPWEVVLLDAEVLRLDIPALGMEGRVVSIMGQAGVTRGALLHTSYEAFQRFLARASARHEREAVTGSSIFAIDFTREHEMPETMVREAAEHGLPLPAPGLYPAILDIDADGVPRPLTRAEVQRARAVAEALARFFEKHRWIDFRRGPILTERIPMEHLPARPVATITAPYSGGAASGPGIKARGAPPAAVRATTREALKRVLGQVWGPRFRERHPDEVERALEDIAEVLAGSGAQDAPEIFRNLGSLPFVWAACWRPMAGGRTGLSEARDLRALQAPVAAAAVERLARARGVFAEILHVDVAAAKLWARDLFNGSSYELEAPRSLIHGVTRHMRLFSVLVEIGDGTWEFPSSLFSNQAISDLTPAAFLEIARAALTSARLDAGEIDKGAPHAGLARWAGLVAARLLAFEPEAPPPRKKRIMTSEGHLVEMHKAVLTLPPAARAALFGAKASDLLRDGDKIDFLDRSLTKLHAVGEAIGSLGLDARGKLHLETIARERFERILGRIQEITGVRPTVESHRAERPPLGDLLAEPGEDAEEMMMGSSAPIPAASAPRSIRALQMSHLRASLDHSIPTLGGAPRALVATAEGRERVEGWLREAERLGITGTGEKEGRFLDLDELRLELGLPAIAADLPASALRRKR